MLLIMVTKTFLLILLFTITPLSLSAMNLYNRLGIGATQQLGNNLPALSCKIQKSDLFSFGLLVGINSGKTDKSYATGVKVYRNLFDEPYLTFYSSLMFALIGEKRAGQSDTGFQLDLTVGPEFHFSGLQSIGFSFETGFSLKKTTHETILRTAGYHIVQAAVHFYL